MDANARAWSLLTKTRDGVVSILRELTLDECRRSYQRLNPEYGFTYVFYENPRAIGSFGTVGPPTTMSGDNGHGGSIGCLGPSRGKETIELREVFGPPNWDHSEISEWDEWPRREYIAVGDSRHPATHTRERLYLPNFGWVERTQGDRWDSV